MKLACLTADQQAMVFACARELNALGVDFVLIAGKGREAAVMANICPSCAADLLAEALSGAAAARDRGQDDVNMGVTLQ